MTVVVVGDDLGLRPHHLALGHGLVDGRRLAPRERWPVSIGAVAVAAALAMAGCVGPTVPSPITPSPSGSSSAVIPSSQTPSASPTAAVRSPGPPEVLATISLSNVVDLAPATRGAWFIAAGRAPRVGLLSGDAIVTNVPAGPAPAAIAASTSSVFVAEGEPDTGPPGQPRTQVLERLDTTSLAVERSVAAPSVVDVAVTPGLVWTVTSSGLVVAYDDTVLAKRWSLQLDGRGRASVSADSNHVWAAIGSIDNAGSGHYVVGRIDAVTGVAMEPIAVPGDGVGPTIIAGAPAWLAIADDPIHDRLYAMNLDGSLRDVGSISAPAGMSRNDQTVLSLGVDGSITIFDASSGEVITSGAAHSSGAAVAVSGDAAYVAIGDQVDVVEPPQR